MTDQEIQEFIDAVKGKKIRWSDWPVNMYFIPNGNFSFKRFYGYDYINNTISPYGGGWYIKNGFNTTEKQDCWQFIDPQDKIDYENNKNDTHTRKLNESDEELRKRINPSCSHPNKYINKATLNNFWVCPDCKADLGDA
jgi:hypothetical protein